MAKAASYSNYGSCVTIWAPGTSINSATYGTESSYNSLSGTSMACPHVAGAAAMILEAAPTYTTTEVKAALTCLAVDLTAGVQSTAWADDTDRILLQVPLSASVSCDPIVPPSASPTPSPIAKDESPTEIYESDSPMPSPAPRFHLIRGQAFQSFSYSYSLEYSH